MYARKDYVKQRNEFWGDEYYTLLDVTDRLVEEMKSKYRFISRASKAFGKCDKYFGNLLCLYCPPRTKTLIAICKMLDVSLQYAVFGGNKESFKDIKETTYKNFVDVYNTAYKGRKCSSVSALISSWKAGKSKYIPLKYLIKVAREQKVTIDWLIGG